MSISKLFGSKCRKTNRKSPSAGRQLTLQSLEDRRLMAADAFGDDGLPAHNRGEVQAELSQTVDDLAEMLSPQTDDVFIEQVKVEGNSLVLDQLDPATFQQIVDAAPIPGLGQLLGESPEHLQALTDLVLLELCGIPDESPQVVQQLDWLASELDLLAELPSDTHEDIVLPQLPPHYEDLRSHRGDHGFAELLEGKAEQFGNLVGVPDLEALEQTPEAVAQFEAVEQILDQWLRRFHGDPADPELPAVLPGDIDGDGTVGFGDFLVMSTHFGTNVDPGTNGDINGDGAVAFADFLTLSTNFGETVEVGILPQDVVDGQVAFHPIIFGPIFLNVITDTHQKDPVKNKASDILLNDKLYPTQKQIEEHEKKIERTEKLKNNGGPKEKEALEGQLKDLKRKVEDLKKEVNKIQKKLRKVCKDKNEAKQVLKDKLKDLNTERDKLARKGNKLATDPKATDQQKKDYERDLHNNSRATEELERLLR